MSQYIGLVDDITHNSKFHLSYYWKQKKEYDKFELNQISIILYLLAAHKRKVYLNEQDLPLANKIPFKEFFYAK